MSSACATGFPRTRSATSRAFWAAIRRRFAIAVASIISLRDSRIQTSALHFLVAGVTAVSAGRRKLAELVTDHFFRYVNGNVLPPVVNRDRQSDHVRQNHRSTRPGLD